MKAPFPWFGGKSKAAPLIWRALGDVANYVEPFAGSLGCLLNRPHAPRIETVNDLDGYLVNFWRAVRAAPEEVAHFADWPVTEIDLTARHLWLVSTGKRRVERLLIDPDYFDAQVAGWWAWGLCAWIGGGWCSGDGPWGVKDEELQKVGGVHRKLPFLSESRGVNRQLPFLGHAGKGVVIQGGLVEYMQQLAARLRHVRICCGDWRRVLTPVVLGEGGQRDRQAGVLLDPPYATSHDVYAVSVKGVAEEVREWALERPHLRIVLCGYEGEFDMPGWRAIKWKGNGATYGSALRNNQREVLWCSPACLF